MIPEEIRRWDGAVAVGGDHGVHDGGLGFEEDAEEGGAVDGRVGRAEMGEDEGGGGAGDADLVGVRDEAVGGAGG